MGQLGSDAIDGARNKKKKKKNKLNTLTNRYQYELLLPLPLSDNTSDNGKQIIFNYPIQAKTRTKTLIIEIGLKQTLNVDTH